MLDQLKRIFGGEPVAAGVMQTREPLDLATASLLIELARADFSESATEIEAIRQVLRKRFRLEEEMLDDLLVKAMHRADRAVSLHEFTHRLNVELPEAEKLAIVEMLWQVSNADGHIDKHEEHLVRRIAGLLHISDRDRIRLKLKTVIEKSP
jgi:uncharacterized tellurite resistance protein B-like protein